jgi:hypothetical protein
MDPPEKLTYPYLDYLQRNPSLHCRGKSRLNTLPTSPYSTDPSHPYLPQGLYLSDIKRSVEILRYKAKEMREYPEFHTALLSRESEMQAFGNLLLERVGVLRMSTLVSRSRLGLWGGGKGRYGADRWSMIVVVCLR